MGLQEYQDFVRLEPSKSCGSYDWLEHPYSRQKMTTTPLETLYTNAVHEVSAALRQALDTLNDLSKRARNDEILMIMDQASISIRKGLDALASIVPDTKKSSMPPREAMSAITSEALDMSNKILLDEEANVALLISGLQRVSHHILAQCLTLRAYAERLELAADIDVFERLISDTCDTIDSLTDIAIGELTIETN